jgi:hypothetical protein
MQRRPTMGEDEGDGHDFSVRSSIVAVCLLGGLWKSTSRNDLGINWFKK